MSRARWVSLRLVVARNNCWMVAYWGSGNGRANSACRLGQESTFSNSPRPSSASRIGGISRPDAFEISDSFATALSL